MPPDGAADQRDLRGRLNKKKGLDHRLVRKSSRRSRMALPVSRPSASTSCPPLRERQHGGGGNALDRASLEHGVEILSAVNKKPAKRLACGPQVRPTRPTKPRARFRWGRRNETCGHRGRRTYPSRFGHRPIRFWLGPRPNRSRRSREALPGPGSSDPW